MKNSSPNYRTTPTQALTHCPPRINFLDYSAVPLGSGEAISELSVDLYFPGHSLSKKRMRELLIFWLLYLCFHARPLINCSLNTAMRFLGSRGSYNFHSNTTQQSSTKEITQEQVNLLISTRAARETCVYISQEPATGVGFVLERVWGLCKFRLMWV